MRKCINCGKEDGNWIAQIKFASKYGFGCSRNKFVCSKECLKAIPKRFEKFKIIKYNGRLNKNEKGIKTN